MGSTVGTSTLGLLNMVKVGGSFHPGGGLDTGTTGGVVDGRGAAGSATGGAKGEDACSSGLKMAGWCSEALDPFISGGVGGALK